MDVYLMIRRKKSTIFIDAKETTTVLEVKKIIEGILKIAPQDQQLFNKENIIMEDDRMIQDYGLCSTTTSAQNPGKLGMAVRTTVDKFEDLELTPYSAPPDLAELMRYGKANGQEQCT